MTTEAKSGNPHEVGHWWKGALGVVGAIFAGGLLTWTGVKSEIDHHTSTIRKLEVKIEHIDGQFDRFERKLDRLLERKNHP